MLTNLLTTAADKYDYKMPIGETSINALVGFLVVFAGISFLILVIWLVGKFMTKGSAKPKKQSVANVEPQNLWQLLRLWKKVLTKKRWQLSWRRLLRIMKQTNLNVNLQ